MSHLPRFPWLVLAAMALAATSSADPVDWSAFNKSFDIAFPGKIDEVRISNVARSAGWLATTYDMIKGNANFATYSSAKENTLGTLVIFR